MIDINTKICVVGLGYVGLSLAIEFAKKFETIGFDINSEKIDGLKRSIDRTGEIEESELKKTKIKFTDDAADIKNANFVVVAVPTPINKLKKPNLKYLKSASELVGKNLSKGSTVIFESTVYPGVIEEICAPIIEKNSGLKCGVDFKIGYSPERINPGDKEYTIDKIIKVVSGMDKESTERIAEIYTQIIKAGVFKAKNIKTAEAAKVIENIQRDLNIALMNELSLIFERIGINTKDVLEAAGTKWNFHKYFPGLVGGHCIGVDPYYLTYKAEELGYSPQVILAGRGINEYMSKHVVDITIKGLIEANKKVKGAKVLLLGLTFKENVKDARNSKAKDIIKYLKEYDIDVVSWDPLLSDDIVEKVFGVKNIKFKDNGKIDAVILITQHDEFKKISLEDLKEAMDNPVLIDVKSFFDGEKAKGMGFIYKSL
jgi:UDP-N-acetyl-D-galactosamine dehydrogenase